MTPPGTDREFDWSSDPLEADGPAEPDVGHEPKPAMGGRRFRGLRSKRSSSAPDVGVSPSGEVERAPEPAGVAAGPEPAAAPARRRLLGRTPAEDAPLPVGGTRESAPKRGLLSRRRPAAPADEVAVPYGAPVEVTVPAARPPAAPLTARRSTSRRAAARLDPVTPSAREPRARPERRRGPVPPTGDVLGPVSPMQAVLGGRPFYSALLDLRHLELSGAQRALLAEGSVAVGVVLALGDVASAWVILALPVTVAVVVKAHDVVTGLLPEPAEPAVAREPRPPRPPRQPPGTRQVDPAQARARARAKQEAAAARTAAKQAARESRTAAKAAAAQRKAEAKRVAAARAAEAKAAGQAEVPESQDPPTQD